MRVRVRSVAFRVLLAIAVLCLFSTALFTVLGRSFFLPGPFADRTADSLDDEGVATFVADRITSEVVSQKPELLGARPLILETITGIIGSRPFRAVVRTAAYRAHQAVFSRSGRDIVLSLPDFDVLVRGAMAQAAPELAQKVPAGLTAKLADFSANRQLEFLVDMWRLGRKLRWLALAAVIAAPLLLALALWVAPHRQQALLHGSIGIGIAGFAVLLVLPACRLVAASLIDAPLVQDAADGALRSYLQGLRIWGSFFVGLGVVFAAASSALLQTLDATQIGRWILFVVVRTPSSRLARSARGVALLGTGVLLIMFPRAFLLGAVVLLGTLIAVAGLRELFQLIMTSRPIRIAALERARPGAPVWRPLLVLAVAAGAGIVWALSHNPVMTPEAHLLTACNGHPELCDRRVDQVVFAGAHNAMSNAQTSDWMFPHHLQGISAQLHDGIRALLLDVHRGFPGAARIKTDLEGEQLTHERLEGALGVEGVAAATRIRDRLVGVDEAHPSLYLCHGFCELGAIDFTSTLREVRDFLLENPEEVLIIVLEDYVTSEELVTAFGASGLQKLVFVGMAPPWPTLRELIESGQRAIVFIESGNAGVPWLRPTLGNIQETPYTFYSPDQFSCEPGRGGTQGALFQVNHWIQTTPAPQPKNAEIVNAQAVLLDRLRRCAAERQHLPNIVAVDFYSIGDVFAVVDSLNGVRGPTPP